MNMIIPAGKVAQKLCAAISAAQPQVFLFLNYFLRAAAGARYKRIGKLVRSVFKQTASFRASRTSIFFAHRSAQKLIGVCRSPDESPLASITQLVGQPAGDLEIFCASHSALCRRAAFARTRRSALVNFHSATSNFL
jgi:hypothetical protein